MGSGFWRLAGGTVLGLAAAYVVVAWLDGEKRARLAAGADGRSDPAGGPRERRQSVLDEVQARLQYAIEEGRQAAAEVRAELEASAASPRASSNGRQPPIGSGSI